MIWKPSFLATAATLLAVAVCVFLLDVVSSQGFSNPVARWFSRFSAHATVYDAVINTAFLDHSPTRLGRLGEATTPDTIYVVQHTAFNDSAMAYLDAVDWVEQTFPGWGHDLVRRFREANRQGHELPRLAPSSASVMLVTLGEADSVREAHHCTHGNECRGFVGPLLLSGVAYARDSTLALVFLEEHHPMLSWRVFFLVQRRSRGWVVDRWFERLVMRAT